MNLQAHVESVRKRLIAHRGSYPEIARVGEIDYSWLNKFARGVHPNPRVESVDKLVRALDRFECDRAA